MRSTFPSVVCAATFSLACLVGQAPADIVTFQQIPGARSANDMSPDGRFIVGETTDLLPYLLDTLTNVMITLPPPGYDPVAVSDDGGVVLGNMIDPGTNSEVAAIWTAATNSWQSLGYLPNALSCPSRSSGYELSADGTVAVGLSWDGCNGRGFRWTQATGMIELQSLANGNNRASVCSANGNVIGGFAQGTFSRTPAVWNNTAAGQLIDPPNGDVVGEIYAVNEAGTLLLGSRNGKAATWTYPALAMSLVGVGSIIPGWEGVPQDISNAGTIVGFDILGGNRRAWIHPAGAGPIIDLKIYIESNGGTVPSDMVLEVCQAISNDGRIIIGHGALSNAWRVTIDSTLCVADIVPSNAVDVNDLLAVITAWGPCAGTCPPHCAADVSPVSASAVGDCNVNVNDLLAVITSWGACPAALGACCTGASCEQLSAAACVASGGVYLGNGVPCSLNACVNNDSCSDAVNITAKINGPAVLGDNTTATPAFGGGDTELPAGSPSCQFQSNPGAAHSTVWYSFIAPANGSVTIATCTSTPAPFFDSLLALYSGDCSKLDEVECSEDDCATPPAAPYYSRIVATGLTPGVKYFICVMNPGDWLNSVPGPFRLTITSP